MTGLALLLLHLSVAQADILPPTPEARGALSEDPPPPDRPPSQAPTPQIALAVALLILAGGGMIWHKNQSKENAQ